MDTLTGNKLIAIFDGWISNKYENLPNRLHEIKEGVEVGLDISEFKYHASWDWLMPVVEKINGLCMDEHGQFGVIIYSTFCQINYSSDVIIESKSNSKLIISVWEGIISFIQWYNTPSIQPGK